MEFKSVEFLTGIIIAGENARIGIDKPIVEIKPEISIRTLYNLIGLFCSEIIFSANCPEAIRFLDEKVVPDEIGGIGPIGTIVSVLKNSSSKKNLIVTCDMPLVPAGLIHLLVEKKEEAEFVVPAWGTYTIEPLCAIYDKSVIPALLEMIDKGDFNINNLPKYCNTKLVQVYNGNNIFKNRSINHHHIEKR